MDAATVVGTRLTRVRAASCAKVALLVCSLYFAWTAAYLLTPGHDVRDFIHIGTVFLDAGRGRSQVIHLDPGYRPLANQNKSTPGLGYDGQFSYYIALDPGKARYYIDLPSLRYARILYPLTARALALGHRTAIPWALLLINLLAVAGGTWALATWLQRRQMSPWWALMFGLWPGIVFGVQRDLTEPLAYALVIAGLVLLDRPGRWWPAPAGILFGLAGLARETTLIFPLLYGLWLAFGGDLPVRCSVPRANRWQRAAILLGLSLLPYVAYAAFLSVWLGSLPTSSGDFTPVPFAGLVHGPYALTRQGVDLAFVVLPALVALLALAPRRRWPPSPSWLPWLLLIANVLGNIVFYALFYLATYTTVSRAGIGIVLSALMCLPYLGELDARRRQGLALAAALSMSLLPVVAVYGFANLSA